MKLLILSVLFFSFSLKSVLAFDTEDLSFVSVDSANEFHCDADYSDADIDQNGRCFIYLKGAWLEKKTISTCHGGQNSSETFFIPGSEAAEYHTLKIGMSLSDCNELYRDRIDSIQSSANNYNAYIEKPKLRGPIPARYYRKMVVSEVACSYEKKMWWH